MDREVLRRESIPESYFNAISSACVYRRYYIENLRAISRFIGKVFGVQLMMPSTGTGEAVTRSLPLTDLHLHPMEKEMET